jgi:transposase
MMLPGGASFSTIKQRLGTTTPAIIRWKQRFVAAGLDGLDTRNPGQPAAVLIPQLRTRILSATRRQPKVAPLTGVAASSPRLWTAVKMLCTAFGKSRV